MFRFLAVLAVLAPQAVMASTWESIVPNAYDNRRVVTPEEMKIYEAARVCEGAKKYGLSVRTAEPPEFAVFQEEGGKVYRVFYATAEHFDKHLCWPE